ncbi:hypothetical protein KRMM14A1259_17340 [Krasilnikovia sp. MM14-A1259]
MSHDTPSGGGLPGTKGDGSAPNTLTQIDGCEKSVAKRFPARAAEGCSACYRMASSCPVIDDCAKDHLHGRLRSARQAPVWMLDGLSEYDVRHPLTATRNPDLVEARP